MIPAFQVRAADFSYIILCSYSSKNPGEKIVNI